MRRRENPWPVEGHYFIDDLKNCDVIVEAIIEQLPASVVIWSAGCGLSACGDFASNTSRDDYGNRYGYEAAATVRRAALLQSRAGDEAGGGSANDSDGARRFMRRCWRSVKSWERPQCAHTTALEFHREPAASAVSSGCDSRAGEGVGSIEDIDNSMKLGCGHPMGR